MNGRRIKVGVFAAALAALALWAATLPPLPVPLERLAGGSTVVAASDGTPLRVFLAGDGRLRLPADPGRVDPLYRDLLIAIEDRRFAHHPGVDPLAVGRAIGQALSAGRVVSGASTLTMQTVRLLDPRPRTVPAKLLEMVRAIMLERRLDKDWILAAYLTLAPFGGNLEGVRAGSLAYFGKEPSSLTPAEAALLVAIPQAPERLRPDRHPAAAKRARDRILARAVEAGVLPPVIAGEAMADPVPTTRRPLPFHAPHLTGRLARQSTGQTVRTTIDFDLQARIERMAAQAAQGLDDRAGLAILIADAETGAVRAHLGAPDYFSRPRSGAIDMTRAVRSPGSALKPLIYGMAIDAHLVDPRTRILDRPGAVAGYAPSNFRETYLGDVSIATALRQSLNVPAVKVLNRLGPTRFTETLDQAGVPLHLPGSSARPGLAVALGGVGITLEDLAGAYTALATDGRVRRLRALADRPAVQPRRLIRPEAAHAVTAILRAAPPPPLAKRDPLRPVAWKTGTSYGFRDAWSVGTDGRHVVAVWVGRPDGSPSPGRYGRNTAAPFLFDLFALLPRDGGPVDLLPAPADRPLPDHLIRFEREAVARVDPNDRLDLVFPIDGSELPWRDGDAITLTARGGKRPLTWLVDGRPIESPAHRRKTGWVPAGPGFATVTVLDAEGRAARAEVRLRP